MKKKNLVLGITIFSMVAMLNVITLTNSNNGISNLMTIQAAMAVDCPEGTPEGNIYEAEPRDCMACDNWWHLPAEGNEIVCVEGCSACNPVACDATCNLCE